jgi:hypothetical protein
MRRAIRLAANLYPQAWRERYGVEFDALLEDHDPGWREFSDVLRGALKMQITNATIYVKLASALAVTGAIVATAVSFSFPRRYESTAVLRMSVQQNPQHPISPEVLQELAAEQLRQIEHEVLSPSTLKDLIVRGDLDLYPEARRRTPVEDVVQSMRHHDIRIRMVKESSTAAVFAISFAYPDWQKAQAVVRELTKRLVDQNVRASRLHQLDWQEAWPQSAPPRGPNLEVIEAPILPRKPVNASGFLFATVGLFLGLTLGLLVVVGTQRPKWTLQLAGFALACCALAFAVSLVLPGTYTSIAVMQFTPPYVPEDPTRDTAAMPPAAELKKLQQKVLSDAGLMAIITNPSIELYKKQRAQKATSEVVAAMRHDLIVRPLNQSSTVFQIAFSYPDTNKAQAVVREVVAQFAAENVRAEREGDGIEMLNPPSSPQEISRSPDRLAIALAGLAAGVLLGAISLRRRRHSETLQTA